MNTCITKNDIKLLMDLLTLSNMQSKPLVELLKHFNLKGEAVEKILNTSISKGETSSNTDETLNIREVVTDELLANKQSKLKVLQSLLDESTDIQPGIAYCIAEELLNTCIHKPVSDVKYKGDSLYLRVVSEINTQFKDAKVMGSLENKVSSILKQILLSAINATGLSNRVSYTLKCRFIRNTKYKYLSGDPIEYIENTVAPDIAEALDYCAPALSLAVQLSIYRDMKLNRLREMKQADISNMQKYEQQDFEARIHRLSKQISTMDKRLDVIVKHCAYEIMQYIPDEEE